MSTFVDTSVSVARLMARAARSINSNASSPWAVRRQPNEYRSTHPRRRCRVSASLPPFAWFCVPIWATSCENFEVAREIIDRGKPTRLARIFMMDTCKFTTATNQTPTLSNQQTLLKVSFTSRLIRCRCATIHKFDDGRYRLMIRKVDDRVRIYTRRGADYSTLS